MGPSGPPVSVSGPLGSWGGLGEFTFLTLPLGTQCHSYMLRLGLCAEGLGTACLSRRGSTCFYSITPQRRYAF